MNLDLLGSTHAQAESGDIQMKGVVNGTLRVAMATAGEADVFSRRSVHRDSESQVKGIRLATVIYKYISGAL